jgi:hypothetical protein
VSPVATSPTGDDGRSPASYFKVGDCIQDIPQTGSNVTVVDCSKPHLVEVYGVFMLPDGAFPGEAAITDYKAKCPETIRQYMTPEEGTDPSNGRTLIKVPDADSWALGDRSVSCYIAFPAPRTGAFGAGKWIK